MAAAGALVAAGVSPFVVAAGSAIDQVSSRFLPSVERPLLLPTLPERSNVYAANGALLATVYQGQDREIFPIADYSATDRHAVLAIEDHLFYDHGAIDPVAIVRALLANLRAGEIVQGGSTITQQLAKNLETGGADTLRRKILEAQDAIRLASTYPKDQILDTYLNTVFMGNSVYGFGTAARYYFDVAPSALTPAQAATLAAMLEAPAYYDPLVKSHLPELRARRNLVLQRMVEYHWLAPGAGSAAMALPVKVTAAGRTENRPGQDPMWIDFVRHLFLSDPRFGASLAQREALWYQGGLQIHTTLEPSIQRAAIASLRRHFAGPQEPQASSVTIAARTGAILAMANGNVRYGLGQGQTTFSNAWQGQRPTGSAFKIFTLAAALESGVSPTSRWATFAPRTVPNCGGGQTWTVHNAEQGLTGMATLAQATADSINTVFAQVINTIGPEAVQSLARKMGVLGGSIPPVCPITLGDVAVSPLAMTAGAQTLADGGIHCMPYAIASIARDGHQVYRAQPSCRRVMPADIAETETSILQQVICCGTAAGIAKLPEYPARQVAGKTGTDTNFKNAYFIGYVPQMVTGVWVGYMDQAQRSLKGVNGLSGFGADMAGPIWADIMTAALRNLPIVPFIAPPPWPAFAPSPPSSMPPSH
jgi:membrane peptidoglycan carboxypeptidase